MAAGVRRPVSIPADHKIIRQSKLLLAAADNGSVLVRIFNLLSIIRQRVERVEGQTPSLLQIVAGELSEISCEIGNGLGSGSAFQRMAETFHKTADPA